MKRATLLFMLLLLTAVMSAVEYALSCPLLFAPGVLYIGSGVVIAAFLFCCMLRYKPKDLMWCIAGGIISLATVNSALCLLSVVVPHLGSDGVFLLCAVLAMVFYMLAVCAAAIYFYLVYFCRFKSVLNQID